jgi:F-box/leucine-rich repeat protein 2/20
LQKSGKSNSHYKNPSSDQSQFTLIISSSLKNLANGAISSRMLLPALLPKEFAFCSAAKSEEALFKLLVDRPGDLLDFFEYACDDETWSSNNAEFMQEAFKWFTVQFLNDQLSLEFAKRVMNAFQLHYSILRNYIPLNLTISNQTAVFELNSLLFAARSERFHDLIRKRHIEKENISKLTPLTEFPPNLENTPLAQSIRKAEMRIRAEEIAKEKQKIPEEIPLDQEVTLTLNIIPYDLFSKIAIFVMQGTVSNLWREDKDFLLRLLHEATTYELTELQEECEEILKRYIAQENVIDLLILSHKEKWTNLRQSCFNFLNERSIGIKVSPGEHKRIDVSQKDIFPLAFEFFDFREPALEVYAKLNLYITHLICSGSLMEDVHFSEVVKTCPHLISIDLSRTLEFSDRLLDLDTSLEELDLSKCEWMSDTHLKRIIQACPNLSRLGLSGDEAITFRGWSDLQNLSRLISLDISRCGKINDEDFELILKACPQLIELNVEECRRISNKGFYALAKMLPHLAFLNLARTSISDAALIDIVTKCRKLRELNINRCDEISEKGILQTVLHAPSLKELKLSKNYLSVETVKNIKVANFELNLIEI